ncbi:P-loop containing nucleoside triphosphate hydrolase protein [Pelagophyceae sp. CCMP2097]|nr:P-loop containing nucleoside triphosphate hydrolase protein [Pelagophyceae sp. CCMP2097]
MSGAEEPGRKRVRRAVAEGPKEWDSFNQCWRGADDAADGENAVDAAEPVFVSAKERRETKEQQRKARRKGAAEEEAADGDGEGPDEEAAEENVPRTLLTEAAELRAHNETLNPDVVRRTRQQEEEAYMLKEASRVQTNALQSAQEIATDKVYTESLVTEWKPPAHIRDMPASAAAALRKKWCIICDGDDAPAPIKSFADMALPRGIMRALDSKGIKKPTPIQVQGIPVALAGRDMIGIAFTGSGKTITFSIPLVVRALERARGDEAKIGPGDGPVGMVLCPSRELARQTFEVIEHMLNAHNRDARNYGEPMLYATCAIGGERKGDQLDAVRRTGIHALVATPGRLIDFLEAGDCNLKRCCYLCLDEGDRMLDLGFDEEVSRIINHFSQQRQTLLFSATMPQKFQDFARGTLVRPVLVNVSRAGAANLDVIQEVEYVKVEARIVYLLECLQKTAPPVLIFCERKGDVDDIHEYLLLKGVDAVSIHGGKDQAERNAAIDAFKTRAKDVLVATDIAAKGLDFPDIQHVINFDMPTEIENYVHRIGRTGRCGKTGVATTFINKTVEPSALLDLKHLLVEAKQRVPPVLQVLDEPDNNIINSDGTRGCSFCGGLGHRITDCPKRDKDARRMNSNRRDMISGTGGVGGDW